MAINFLDIIVILMILYGAFKGWRYGGFTAVFNLIGTVFVFIVAYFVKNPLSEYMYTNWPFISFGGIFAGISSFNILFYEGLAYVISVVILSIILKILLKVTGIVDKILNLTIVLALPSKILGLLCGAFQHYIYAFILLFILAQVPFSSKYYNESFLGNIIVGKTPGLSYVTSNIYNSASEVYKVCVEHETDDDKTNADLASLAIMLKYNIITLDGVNLLVDSNKLRISGIDEFISEWEENGEYVIDEDVSKTMNDAVNKVVEEANKKGE